MKTKGMIFNIFLVLMAILILTYAFLGLTQKYNDVQTAGNPFEIIKAYQASESTAFYTDQAAKYSLQQSLYDMGVYGAYFEESQCGYYLGDAVWNNKEKREEESRCFPDYNQSITKFLQYYLNMHSIEYNDQNKGNLMLTWIKAQLNDNPKNPSLNLSFSNFHMRGSENELNVLGFPPLNIQINYKDGTAQYSLKPNFNIKEVYSTSDYPEYLFKKSKEIEEYTIGEDKNQPYTNKDLQNWEKQAITDVNLYLDENRNYLEWQEHSCDKGYEKVFYDFMEQITACRNSTTLNCKCEIDLDYSDDPDYENNEYYLEGEYKIIIAPNNEEKDTTKITIETNGLNRIQKIIEGDYYYTESMDPVDQIPYYNVLFTYDKKGELTSAKLEQLSSEDDTTPELKINWGTKKIYMFKTDKHSKDAFFLKGSDLETFEFLMSNYPDCAIEKEYYRYCVKNNKDQYYTYEHTLDLTPQLTLDNTKELMEREINYNFVYYLEDLPPPPVMGIQVYNKETDEEALIVKWDESTAEDVWYYRVYYTNKPGELYDADGKVNWENLNPRNDYEIDRDRDTDVMSIVVSAIPQIGYVREIIPTTIDFSQKLGVCTYKYTIGDGSSKELRNIDDLEAAGYPDIYQPYILDQDPSDDKLSFFVVLHTNEDDGTSNPYLEDDKEYYVYVVAIDKYGNELRDEMPPTEPITVESAKATTKDTLAPLVCDGLVNCEFEDNSRYTDRGDDCKGGDDETGGCDGVVYSTNDLITLRGNPSSGGDPDEDGHTNYCQNFKIDISLFFPNLNIDNQLISDPNEDLHCVITYDGSIDDDGTYDVYGYPGESITGIPKEVIVLAESSGEDFTVTMWCEDDETPCNVCTEGNILTVSLSAYDWYVDKEDYIVNAHCNNDDCECGGRGDYEEIMKSDCCDDVEGECDKYDCYYFGCYSKWPQDDYYDSDKCTGCDSCSEEE